MSLDESQLDDLLSRPTDGVIETLRRHAGDIIVLGAAGKIGPSLTRMLCRACERMGDRRKVFAASLVFEPGQEAMFQSWGARTIQCDLLDRAALAALPDAANVFFLAGMKFGSTGNESLTWAMNVYLPGLACEKYSRGRIAAFSTGNIYGLVSPQSGGSVEADPPNPLGDYAMSCLGRERIFDHFSRAQKTPVALIRLNYACECRYGVLVDLAQQVWAGRPIDLAMARFNVIWQGDAVAMTIQALSHAVSPAAPINVAGAEILHVREVCEQLGKLMGRKVSFAGTEGSMALLNNASRAFGLFGKPAMPAGELIRLVAEWVSSGGRTLNKPTHFEVKDGKF